MNVYRVVPAMPVFQSPYFVVAENFGEAESKVLEVENSGELDCRGIKTIECWSSYSDEEPRQFIGF